MNPHAPTTASTGPGQPFSCERRFCARRPEPTQQTTTEFFEAHLLREITITKKRRRETDVERHYSQLSLAPACHSASVTFLLGIDTGDQGIALQLLLEFSTSRK